MLYILSLNTPDEHRNPISSKIAKSTTKLNGIWLERKLLEQIWSESKWLKQNHWKASGWRAVAGANLVGTQIVGKQLLEAQTPTRLIGTLLFFPRSVPN